MSNLVHNERTKMAASFFNSVAVVCLGTGIAIPTISMSIADKPVEVHSFAPFALGTFFSLLSITIARTILGHLKE
jgi:hypothetical protein